MRERLIELLGDYLYSEKIADHLLKNGVIVPPCKVGQTVYRVVTMGTGVTFKKVGYNTYRAKEQTIKHFIRCVTVTQNNFFDVCENWGKTVFLTKEEALSKLQASCKQVKGGVDNGNNTTSN